MSTDDLSSSPPRQYGRIARLSSFLPLSSSTDTHPMTTHGQGALSSLIRSRSNASLQSMHRRPPSFRAREDDEFPPSLLAGIRRNSAEFNDAEESRWNATEERRLNEILFGPQMRSQRLIGNSNPRYRWEKYWKTEEQLKKMKKPIREYYERTNSLVQQYIYTDRLLDSSLPHDLLNEYNGTPSERPVGTILQNVEVPPTISEEPRSLNSPASDSSQKPDDLGNLPKKIKRTPRELYKVVNDQTPLLATEDEESGPKPNIPGFEDDSVESGDKIVLVAIYINLMANALLLAGKIAVIALTSSLSVLASLVDAALDLLSTGIVWTTTTLIDRQDQYRYPVGRRRLEPIGVLVFSVIMITSFCQVGLQCINRLTSNDHSIIELGLPSIIIMSTTVFIKALCWVWCRLIKNSSVQALAQDAMTDVIFNIFSIIFPLVGYYAQLWWLDALGGLLLSLYVIISWADTSAGHIRNLCGAAATADERNVLLYLTMRFAKTIKQIQGLQAYHAGDKLHVEVDIVLDENMSLRDSHDLGESLQYVLESVPFVDRAFVHQDYAGWNLPTHMQQQSV
ncbi:Uncharacterized protein BP5553_07735 [Venustampulla echinocandica]|uniref:Uncharacterized protein n=1 Tax=Venustampulla echinocandica TaxID=2656787 RepID=A0A370THC8_9HELO|nr:Uncharacterized protein BP5553_07735 [Venustampulla echinocandica]RDL34607.1 Uncharacterized protein BP5553_07735 [Venustampulla echinocandica]